ncbi:twin-arginine translocation signal domain-containing protein [Candidatus Woesearchaeota archaeon]|nr:twin-arginine translocation signal domain-containing protein [Candidatus Woesearchaeota archaeon]
MSLPVQANSCTAILISIISRRDFLATCAAA